MSLLTTQDSIAGKFDEHYKLYGKYYQSKNTIGEFLIWRLCYCGWTTYSEKLIVVVLILAFCPKFAKSSNLNPR